MRISLDDLNEKERKVIISLIKIYCSKRNMEGESMYSLANSKGIGLEQTEEIVKKLIEDGDLIIYYNEDKEIFTIEAK